MLLRTGAVKLKLLVFAVAFLVAGWTAALHGQQTGQQTLYLKENLAKARPGDFITTAQSKTYTVVHIRDKKNNVLGIEEISVPVGKFSLTDFSWKRWVEQ